MQTRSHFRIYLDLDFWSIKLNDELEEFWSGNEAVSKILSSSALNAVCTSSTPLHPLQEFLDKYDIVAEDYRRVGTPWDQSSDLPIMSYFTLKSSGEANKQETASLEFTATFTNSVEAVRQTLNIPNRVELKYLKYIEDEIQDRLGSLQHRRDFLEIADQITQNPRRIGLRETGIILIKGQMEISGHHELQIIKALEKFPKSRIRLQFDCSKEHQLNVNEQLDSTRVLFKNVSIEPDQLNITVLSDL